MLLKVHAPRGRQVGVQDDLGRACDRKITQRHTAADRAVEAGRERAGEGQVLLPGGCAVYGSAQGQAARAVNGAVDAQCYRAAPGIGAVALRGRVAQRAAVQFQFFVFYVEAAARELEYAAQVDHGTQAARAAERAVVRDGQDPGLNRGQAGIKVSAAERESGRARLGEAGAFHARADTPDNAVVNAGGGLVHSQGLAFGDVDAAARGAAAGERTDGLGVPDGEFGAVGGRGVIIERDRAVVGEGGAAREDEFAGVDGGRARVAVGAGEGDDALSGRRAAGPRKQV